MIEQDENVSLNANIYIFTQKESSAKSRGLLFALFFLELLDNGFVRIRNVIKYKLLVV